MPDAARPRQARDVGRARLSRAGQCSAGAEPQGLTGTTVIARSAATKQSTLSLRRYGLLRFARNDEKGQSYLFLFTGLRFSMNAAMPSERSSSANVEWNKLRSTFMPSDSGVSNARLMACLAIAAAGCDIEAIFSAADSASSISLSAGTTRLTIPAPSASAASIILPVRQRSTPFDLPLPPAVRW